MIRIIHRKQDFISNLNLHYAQERSSLVYSSDDLLGKSILASMQKEEFRHVVGVSSFHSLGKYNGGRGGKLSLLKGDVEKIARIFSFAICLHSLKIRLSKFNRSAQKIVARLSLALFKHFILDHVLKMKAQKVKEQMSLKENFCKENSISI